MSVMLAPRCVFTRMTKRRTPVYIPPSWPFGLKLLLGPTVCVQSLQPPLAFALPPTPVRGWAGGPEQLRSRADTHKKDVRSAVNECASAMEGVLLPRCEPASPRRFQKFSLENRERNLTQLSRLTNAYLNALRSASLLCAALNVCCH